jgi:hypothetical protein
MMMMILLILGSSSVSGVNATDAVTEDFQCIGICGNNPDGSNVLENPSTTVTYNWASRVPVPDSTIGETQQTMSCKDFDSRLYSFSNDPGDCTEHQTGLEAAGCICGDGSGAGVSFHRHSKYTLMATVSLAVVGSVLSLVM